MSAIFKQTATGVGLIFVVLFGLTVLRLTYFMPLSVDCRQTVHWSGSAPHGAIWERETVHWDHVPDGYTTLVGWVNAATAVPCADETADIPRIDIRRLRIIAQDATGRLTTVADVDLSQPETFVGRLFPRVPHWFGETEGEDVPGVATTTDGQLTLHVGLTPLRVYHGWTSPRLPIDPTLTYMIEIEARMSETARLQFGIDYWRDAASDYTGFDSRCERSTNCEGWVSDWQGGTGGEFHTFRAPAEVTVPAVVTSTR